MAIDIPALLALKQQLGFYGAGGGQRSEGQQIGEALGSVGQGLATAGQGIGAGADIAKKLFEAQKLKGDITSLGTELNLPAERLKNQIFQTQSANQIPVQGPQNIPDYSPVGPNLPAQSPIPQSITPPLTPGLNMMAKNPNLNENLTVGQNKDILDAIAKEKETARTPRVATATDELATGGKIKKGTITNEEEVKLFSTKDNANILAGAQNQRQQNQLAMTQQQINISRENLKREQGKDAVQAFDTLTSAIRTKMEDPNITPDQSKFLNDQLQFASTNGYLPATSVDGMRFLGMTLPSNFPFGKPIQKVVTKTNNLQSLINKYK